MEDRATTIEHVQRIGPGGVAVALATPDGFDAAPGQFVSITAEVDGEEVSRVYTISSPDVRGTFEITVAVDPEGAFTPWLADAAPGTTVQVSGPYGTAYYEGEPDVLVLAGGPGVGPAVAIAERVAEDGGRPTVIYRDETPLHRDRLRALDEDGAAVTILDADAPLTEPVAHAYGENPGQQVFVYGFDGFVTDAEAALAAAEGNLGAAKVENFG